MNFLAATFLVAIVAANAQSPRFRNFAGRQTAPAGGYEASGWRPEGAAFVLPRSQPQRAYGAPPQTYGAPPQTYGAPPQTYGAPPQGAYGPPEEEQPEEPTTTTEIPTTTEIETEEPTTEEPQAERIEDGRNQQNNPAPVYFVLPQNQNYLYAQLVNVPSSRLQALPVYNSQYVQIYQ